jgi:hypothetical protein
MSEADDERRMSHELADNEQTTSIPFLPLQKI